MFFLDILALPKDTPRHKGAAGGLGVTWPTFSAGWENPKTQWKVREFFDQARTTPLEGKGILPKMPLIHKDLS